MIEFNFCDIYTSSGIVGLIRMLDLNNASKYYKIEDNKLKIDKDFLLNADLSQMYFDAFVKKYYNFLNYNQIIDELNNLKNDKELVQEKRKQKKSKIRKKLLSDRYISAYTIVKNKVDFDILADIEMFKSDDSYTSKLLEDLNNDTLKEIMLIKDVAYSIISRFWSGISFLNRQGNLKDPKEEFKRSFEIPLKNYILKEVKSEEYCSECGEKIKGSNKMKPSYVISLAEDFTRKASNYWNFKPTCFICPKCNFLFSLIPLGFSLCNDEYIFINLNSSLEALVKSNNFFQNNNICDSFENLINEFSLHDNNPFVEIVINDSNNYDNIYVSSISFNLILKNIDILKDIAKYPILEIKDSYVNIPYRKNLESNYLNILNIVFTALLKNQPLFPLLHFLIEAEETNSFARFYQERIYKIIYSK